MTIMAVFRRYAFELAGITPVDSLRHGHGQDIRLACAIGFPTGLAFAVFNLMEGFIALGIVEGISVLLLLPAAYFLSRQNKMLIAESLVMLCVISIFLSLFHYGGVRGTGIYWIFSLPFTAFFVSGQLRGWLWSMGLLVATLIIPPAPGFTLTHLVHFQLSIIYYTVIAASFNLLRVKFAKELHQMAMTDPLTMISNRRYFFQRLQEEFARHVRYGTEFCLLFIDLDNVKGINTMLGHPGGDEAIIYCANVLTRIKRQGDVVSRLGGDEFGCLMVGADIKTAEEVFTRVQLAVANFTYNGQKVPLRISAGAVSSSCQKWEGYDAIYRVASDRLKYAKTIKNTVCCRGETKESG